MREGYWVREKNLEGGGGRTVGGGGSNGQRAPLTAHRRRGRGADQGPLQSDLRRLPVYDVEDDDEDLAAATTTATDSVGYWVCVLGIFFFLINCSSPLCSVSSVLVCLVC